MRKGAREAFGMPKAPRSQTDRGPQRRLPVHRARALRGDGDRHEESEHDESSASGWDHSSDDSDDDDDMNSAPAAPSVPSGVFAAPAPGHSDSWGRPNWRIATLRGGWGAVCRYHHYLGAPQRQCQKSVRDQRFSDEEQRRLMKAWLLAGAGIDEGGDRAQEAHVHGVDVYTLWVGLPTEAELDSQMWQLCAGMGEELVL